MFRWSQGIFRKNLSIYTIHIQADFFRGDYHFQLRHSEQDNNEYNKIQKMYQF